MHRIDWSHDPDPTDQGVVPDEVVPIFGSPTWERLSRADKDEVRHHYMAWINSQFLHGEQGALICSAKIVCDRPRHRQQVLRGDPDDGRGPSRRDLRAVPRTRSSSSPTRSTTRCKALLDQTITDGRWDFTYLGMQVMIEGVALAAFSHDPRLHRRPAGQVDQRLRHAGRGPPHRLRPARAQGRLRRAHRGGARTSARSSSSRRPTCCGTGSSPGRCGTPRLRRGRAVRLRRPPPDDDRVPQGAVQPRRADGQGHRAVGSEGPGRLRGHGRAAVPGPRRRGAVRQRRAHRRGGRGAASPPGPTAARCRPTAHAARRSPPRSPPPTSRRRRGRSSPRDAGARTAPAAAQNQPRTVSQARAYHGGVGRVGLRRRGARR